MILTEKRQIIADENYLWEQYALTKDVRIRNQIIEKYSYLVKIIALKLRGIYQNYGDVDDIVNEGIIALIDVIDKFDLSKNIKFETYATIRIRGSIIDYVRKQDWIPRKVKNDFKTVKEAQDALSYKLGREPEDHEVAHHLKMNMHEYNSIIRNAHGTTMLSFEELLSEANVREMETSNGYELPEQELESKELCQVLKDNINKLNEKEKLVVSLYYKEELKLKDIAEVMCISNSRVSQIHTSALEKLEQGLRLYLYDNLKR
ncbi:MAG: FliA/WhiG family RNA polymerase sigma factor [Sedimentibacter sp.]|uniref:sigma-70 family RNA polymerase sigma factor n=1 Tax=Sedimentibacter sp. TaxID=1960295 RepID=UPI0031599547